MSEDNRDSVNDIIKDGILKRGHSICKLCAQLTVLRQAQFGL